MSRFIEKIDKFQEEMKANDGNFPMTYAQMLEAGLLKPATFRLPISTLAMMDELYKCGPWNSKQEMFYELVDDVINEFLTSPKTGDGLRQRFVQAAEVALEEWRAVRQEEAA